MHLINDENGHVCHQGHCHEHANCHEHAHCHEHDNAPAEKPADQNEALLTYMLQHNQSHAAELDQMAGKLREAGKDEAANQVRKAVDEFQKGNMYLSVALAMVKESK